MKTVPQYKTLLLLLLVPFLSFSVNSAEKAKHEKRKTISKEYSVNSNATIEIDNSYGNLDVFTWNENRVVFEITITTSGNDAEKVEKKLEDIMSFLMPHPAKFQRKLFSITANQNLGGTGAKTTM